MARSTKKPLAPLLINGILTSFSSRAVNATTTATAIWYTVRALDADEVVITAERLCAEWP